MAIQSGSGTIVSFSTLLVSAQVRQQPQQITITPTAVPSYGVAALEGVSRTPFTSSTVTVQALIDGLYDS
jgi:hypothetical protein